ncbi:hypothetical protein [Erythrobacter sp. JK5]|uniref:hypothetical protein n=1 Tax=Erythrobacter sp. JK5 TaxID=2829500 RepID=UPI001BA44062|nr:hypothetical protein [Erythrobacter sp. JK5]QUL37229.1 hypothetical protein KDC96_12710 [Erythrobacter sp. JK5]
MNEPRRDYRKRYEELMRHADEHRRYAARRTLESLLRSKEARARLEKRRSPPRPHSLLHVIAVLDSEVLKLKAKLAGTHDQEERILIKAEIAHFEAVMQSLRSDRRPGAGSFDEGNRRKSDRVTNSRVQRVLSALDGPHRAILLSILEATMPKRRRPPEAGIPVPAVPPRGPLPKEGGAEAPLDFETE